MTPLTEQVHKVLEVDTKGEFEQAETRGGKLYADGYVTGLTDRTDSLVPLVCELIDFIDKIRTLPSMNEVDEKVEFHAEVLRRIAAAQITRTKTTLGIEG